jgi:hypothetical protein
MALVALAALAAAGRAAEPADYLTKDGQLKHALEFRDGQGGFAGVTGTAWKVEPDGSWAVTTFLNDKDQKTLARGKLSAKQLSALAGHLAAQDVTGLPKALGGFTGANPHTFTLRFGEHATQVTVAPGQALTETALAGKEAAPWARFVAAAVLVQHWTQQGPKPAP